jgi:acetyltransferase-like isoleucine patch superfamily enzyme
MLINKLKRLLLRRKKIFIYSRHANLKAKYGNYVLVSPGTFIYDDVSIGDYSYINSNSYIEHCTIGKYCSISSNVRIGPVNHNYNLISTHPFLYNNFYNFIQENPVFPDNKAIIKNDVWVGLNSIILRGVTIGNGAIIAAGAVVTKNIPDYEIWGGVPAKFIKKRFPDEKIARLLQCQWWDWDVQKIKANLAFFCNNKLQYEF